MKRFLTPIFSFVFALFSLTLEAQDRTTVTANSDEISDNLDLRAVASVFADSRDLEDFERRLNDPELRISNLDLNNDGRVDYIRILEYNEGQLHLIILQAIIGPDLFQDIATIEVERESQDRTRVLVVGDTFMYGDNFIYEPVFFQPPLIYNHFWSVGYRPYWSNWYWGYYPSWYFPWNPFPVHTYFNHVHIHINQFHQFNYINVRPLNHRAHLINRPIVGNAYATMYPTRSFALRNGGLRNRQELQNVRSVTPRTADIGTRTGTRSRADQFTPSRNSGSTRNTESSVRNQGVAPRGTTPRTDAVRNSTRGNSTLTRPNTVRSSGSTRATGTRSQATNSVRSSSSQPGRTFSTGSTSGVRSTGSSVRQPATNAVRSVNQPTRSSVVTPRASSQPSRAVSTPRNVSSPSRSISTPRPAASPSTVRSSAGAPSRALQSPSPRSSAEK